MELINEMVKKLPRTALVYMSIGFFMLAGLIGNNLYANGEQTKKIAYQAKNATDALQLQVAALSGQIQEVKNIMAKDHEENRADMGQIRDLLSKQRGR